jgi:hypothetical protein
MMTMTDLDSFLQTLAATQPPSNLQPSLLALWHIKKGNWELAHNIAQDDNSQTGSWIHALLHLIEGDLANANYWFYRAKKISTSPDQIDALWSKIVQSHF